MLTPEDIAQMDKLTGLKSPDPTQAAAAQTAASRINELHSLKQQSQTQPAQSGLYDMYKPSLALTTGIGLPDMAENYVKNLWSQLYSNASNIMKEPAQPQPGQSLGSYALQQGETALGKVASGTGLMFSPLTALGETVVPQSAGQGVFADVAKGAAAGAPFGPVGAGVGGGISLLYHGLHAVEQQPDIKAFLDKNPNVKSDIDNALAVGMTAFGLNKAEDIKLGGQTEAPTTGTPTEPAEPTMTEKAGQWAQGNLKDFWNSTFRGTKSGANVLDESLSFGKDPTELLANKKITPEMEGTKINTKNAVAQLEESEKPLNDIMKKVLQTSTKTVPLEELRNKVLDAVNTPDNKAKNLVGDLQEQINKEFDAYKKTYGDNFKLSDLQDIKINKGIQSRVFDQTRPQWRSNVDYQISKAARLGIEGAVGDDVNIKGLNQYIGQHEDAIDLLNKINGQTVKGGRLGKYVGTMVGSTLGKSIPGKVAGALGGNYIVDALMNMDVNNPVRNYLLKYAQTNEPDVLKQAQDFLSKQTPEQPPTGIVPKGQGEAPTQQNTNDVKTVPETLPDEQKGTPGALTKAQALHPSNFDTFDDFYDKVDKADNLTTNGKNVEKLAYQKFYNDPDGFIKQYLDKNKNVVNPDEVRPFFSDRANPKLGYHGSNSADVHEPSTLVAKLIWNKLLTENPQKDAVVYCGGSGVGKSSAIGNIPELSELKQKSAAIWDGNLSSLKSAQDRITEIQNAGKTAHFVYVYRDPIASFEKGVVFRMNTNPDEMGRVVPTDIIAVNHKGSLQVIKALYENASPDAKKLFHFVDNTGDFKDAHESTFADISAIKYPSDLLEQLNNKAKELYENGTIKKFQYRKYIQRS